MSKESHSFADVARPYIDDGLQRKFLAAKKAGDFDVLACCGHIRHVHDAEREWCRACWVNGEKCAGGAK